MSAFAGEDLFGSGPHAFRLGPWQRAVQNRAFAGVHGELLLDLGIRSRKIRQTGRLQADSADALHALLSTIDGYCDGAEHALVDNHGRSYASVILEQLETTTPVQRGRGFYCDYKAEYRQLP